MSIKDHIDGWVNAVSGIGQRGIDKRTAGRPSSVKRTGDGELANLYAGGGLARRVVDMKASDATRAWAEFSGDDDGELLQYVDSLGVQDKFREALTWAGAFGGALIVIGVDDGGAIDEPLSATHRSVDWLKVFDRRRVPIDSTSYNLDVNSSRYGRVESYPVYPLYGAPFRVHHTRAIPVSGESLPDDWQEVYNGWGQPLLEAIWEEVRDLESTYGAVANIMQDFSTGKLRISNLQQLLANGRESEVRDRAEIMAYVKSVINMIIIGEDEEYEEVARSVAGVPEVLDRLMMRVSSVSGVPVSKLFGRSAAGMNSTGENDVRDYYDEIANDQRERVLPGLRYIAELCNNAADGPGIADYEIEMHSLWQMDDKEKADIRNIMSQADERYYNMGALDSPEIRQSRFGGSHYSIDTTADLEATAMFGGADDAE